MRSAKPGLGPQRLVVGECPGSEGLKGIVVGTGLAYSLHLVFPGLPVQARWEYVAASLAMSTVVGLVSGVAPARRAAALDPVEALRAE